MAKKPGLKSKKLFLAFLIIGLLINPIGLSQSAGQPAIKLFSILSKILGSSLNLFIKGETT